MRVKLLTLENRDLIKGYFTQYPPIFSECTFSNLFIWGKDRPTYFCEVDGTLIFLIKEEGEYVIFGPPIGQLPLEEVIRRMPVTINKAIRTTLPSNLKALDWTFTVSAADADYVYKVSDLIELPGHNYHRKRQLVRGCLDRYKCAYEPLNENNLQECLELMERLYEESSHKHEHEHEHHATIRLFKYYNHFDVFGGVIRIDGQVQGFMIAEELNPNTAVGHAEKTSHDYHGLSELMHHWLAKYSLTDFTYFNLEQDLGIPGLREAKLRFHPDHMIIKWNGMKHSTDSL